MKLKQIMLGGLGLSVLASPAFADGTDFSFAVHDVNITSYTQMVNISVRNVSNSTDPADRDLRMVSADPVVNINGQVWCNSYEFAETGAFRADVRLGQTEIVSAPGGGAEPAFWSGSESPLGTQIFNGTNTLENFAFQSQLDLPENYDADALINISYLNPARVVEDRLEQFLENNAGTEADFLRQDDVFEVEFDISVVGWCSYESDILDNDYAGARWVTVTAAIFYQGDDDIQDLIQTVGGADSVAAPVPNRARETATTRGSSSTPPARNTRPARARVETVGEDRASGDDNEAALLLPAVQSAREASRRSRSGNDKPAILADKQQVGRGRARSRATVDATASASPTTPLNDGTDTDSDGARAAMQTGRGRARARATVNASAAPGVEPDVISARIAGEATETTAETEPHGPPFRDVDGDQSQATPLDALMIINRNADDGVEPDEID
jgi:hypothetical protein